MKVVPLIMACCAFLGAGLVGGELRRADAAEPQATLLPTFEFLPAASSGGEQPMTEPLERGPFPSLGSASVSPSNLLAQEAGNSRVVLAATTAWDTAFAGLHGSAQPSDGALAVGPSHVLEIVNGVPGETNVAVFDKSGRALMAQSLSSLLGIAANTYLTDARAYYDSLSAKWFVSSFSINFTTPAASMYLAISATADPTAGFCYFHKDASLRGGVTGQAMPDFPGMGMDEYALYLTYVRFPFFDTVHPLDTRVEMFPRASLSCGNASLDPYVWTSVRTAPDGRSVWTVQPTTALDSSGVAYFVGTSNGGSYVAVWNVTHSTSPLLNASYVPVAPYFPPPDSPQPGTSVPLATNDNRVPAAGVYRQGSLWLSFPAQSSRSGFSAVFWYELSVPSLSIRQQGEVWSTTNAWAFPALMLDRSGGVFMSATAVGPTYAPRQNVLSRFANDPLGEFGLAAGLPGSAVAYTTQSSGEPAARWGDFFGVALDPDGMHVWIEGSFSTDGRSWSTTIASTHLARPAAASYRLAVSDASPLAGAAITVVAQALDNQGQPARIAGQTLTWRSTGQGRFSNVTSVTDVNGLASVQFTTDANIPQSYTITATDSGGAFGTSPPFTSRARPTPTAVVYLPNITKTLGGPLGWTTPFYIQNTGQVATDLDVVFFRFADGAQVAQRSISALAPGATYADGPNADPDLSANTQFSVVIRSYGSSIVAVVAQIQGTGTTTEALMYTGSSAGANKLYLPNVTRRFFGYDVPIIIQNLGAGPATATARFVSFDGTQTFALSVRAQPGRSVVIDPDFTDGLVDGTQYAVSITADQPITAVANAHNELGSPVAFSHLGLATGSTTLLAPIAVKGGPSGQFSPVVVQNIGSSPTDVTLTFAPLGAVGNPQTFVLSAVAPGGSRAFDPRFILGTTTPCATASPTCLGPGEYSLKISAATLIAALVLPVSNITADAYVTPAVSNTRGFLPIVSRASGAIPAWTSRFAIDAPTGGTASIRWYRVGDGALATITTLNLVTGTSVWVDPRSVVDLADGQYSVVIEATAPVTTAVQHSYPGGDGSMFNAGFAGAP